MAPLSEELIIQLFGAWRADIDSEPYAHEDAAIAVTAGLLAEESAA